MHRRKSQYSLDESLGHLASNASRVVLRRINQELARRGFPVTSEQFSVIVHVWDRNGQPQYMLTEKLFKDKTTMARLVSGLEAQGLVVRMPGQRDAREKNVFLTKKGKDMMPKVIEAISGILEQAQRGISPEELKICKDVLRRFSRNLL